MSTDSSTNATDTQVGRVGLTESTLVKRHPQHNTDTSRRDCSNQARAAQELVKGLCALIAVLCTAYCKCTSDIPAPAGHVVLSASDACGAG